MSINPEYSTHSHHSQNHAQNHAQKPIEQPDFPDLRIGLPDAQQNRNPIQYRNGKKYIYTWMGDIQLANEADDILVCNGLGSCIALVIYDPFTCVGAMAHVVNPVLGETKELDSSIKLGQYANIAVPKTLELFARKGGQIKKSMVRIVGGAQMFKQPDPMTLLSQPQPDTYTINTGLRNTVAVKGALKEMDIPIAKAHTGGSQHRCIRLEISTGQITLTVGDDEVVGW